MEPLWSPAGATSSNRRQIARAKERQKQAKTVAAGLRPMVRGSTVRVRQRALNPRKTEIAVVRTDRIEHHLSREGVDRSRRTSCRPNSARTMPRHTCAGQHRSWRRSAPVWPRSRRRLTHPHRALRTRTRSDARHRFNDSTGAAPARRPTRNRPDDRIRSQQPRPPLERRLRQPARAGRSVPYELSKAPQMVFVLGGAILGA
jgi:hypothetical protein